MPRALARSLLAALACAVLLLAGRDARAFCGFYVSGADAKLTNGATVVVLMRDGNHTVLSMQNHYEGPPSRFAMVVPVPVVLSKDNVRTLSREVFDHVDRLAAPRLVEYWERDPCAGGEGIGLAGIGGMGFGSGAGRGGASGASLGVTVEAQFTVGEYEIVILSAEDAAGLEEWLRRERYAIPDGAAAVLRPYVAQGTKFFVARVDPAKVKFEHGAAVLSPLRFDYDAPSFSLPVRLGLLNSAGEQDLVVHILAEKRYEVANYPNVTVPTNVDVPDAAREDFAATYAGIFDQAVASHPGAVVTEYAWSPGTCNPCPGPTLSGADFMTLGGDVVPSFSGKTGAAPVPQLRQGTTSTKGPLPAEVVQRIVRQNFGRFRLCYQNGLQRNPNLSGTAALAFTITQAGEVTAVSTAGSTIADADVLACVARGAGNLSFPEEKAPTKVTYPLQLSTTSGLSGPASGWVLTRLHARYGKDSLGEDLVFRPADPIVGGRETRGADGALEQGAQPSSTNNFQARYAIRHPWTGPITCDSPHRGIWGPKPGEATTPPMAAANIGFLRATKGLGAGVAVAIPRATPPPAASGQPSPAPSTSAEPAPSPPPRRGCGGCTATGVGANLEGCSLAAVAVALLTLRRRSSRRAR